MTDDSKNALGALLVGWVGLNILLGFIFLQESIFDNACHSLKRIEYVLPGPKIGCEVGKVGYQGLNWLLGDSK